MALFRTVNTPKKLDSIALFRTSYQDSYDRGNSNALLGALSHPDNDKTVQLLIEHGADIAGIANLHDDPTLATSPTHGSEERELPSYSKRSTTFHDEMGSYNTLLGGAMDHLRDKLNENWTSCILLVEPLLIFQANLRDHGNYYGNRLQQFAFLFNADILLQLLNEWEDVNIQGGLYGSSLQAAAASEKDSCRKITLLLRRGAQVNGQGGVFGNPLQAAATVSDEAGLLLLLQEGADSNAQGGPFGNALQAAALSCSKSGVQMLLERGADVHAQGGYYSNALQAAAVSSIESTEKVQLLLEHGADPSVHGGHHGFPLHAAVRSEYRPEKTLKILLGKGVDVNTQGGFWGSALQSAAFLNNRTCIDLLLKNGASVLIGANRVGEENALVAALNQGAYGDLVKGIVRLLLKEAAKANAPRDWYEVALKCQEAHTEVLQLIRDHLENPKPRYRRMLKSS